MGSLRGDDGGGVPGGLLRLLLLLWGNREPHSGRAGEGWARRGFPRWTPPFFSSRYGAGVLHLHMQIRLGLVALFFFYCYLMAKVKRAPLSTYRVPCGAQGVEHSKCAEGFGREEKEKQTKQKDKRNNRNYYL